MSQSGIPLPSALDLRGRRALVTGAASGIGRATATALAQLGAELLLADRAPLAEVTRRDRADRRNETRMVSPSGREPSSRPANAAGSTRAAADSTPPAAG